MRRGTIFLFTTGLLLSHAGMAWLGKASSRNEAATSSHQHTQATRDAASDPDRNPWTIDALSMRLAERQRKEAAEMKAVPPWLEQVAAARAAMPAGTDYAALLDKVLAALPPGDDAEFGAEGVAAFGLWLDRDPAAALTWAGRTNRDHWMGFFSCEVERWLAAGAHSQVQDYLDRFPLAQHLLLQAAEEITEDRGPDFALDLAARLTNPKQRYEFLDSALASDELAGRLVKFRALLNDLQAREFLLQDIRYMGAPSAEFLAEIRAAGFPPSALEKYEEWVETSGAQKDENPVPDHSPETIARELKEGSIEGLTYAVPQFWDWRKMVGEGRMTPQEMLDRMREAWPPAAGVEPQIRALIFPELMPIDPVETLRWLRESGGDEEWRTAMSGHFAGLTAEQMAAVLADLPPGAELTEWERGSLGRELGQWLRTDPDGYAAARERMAGDDRQQAFAAMMDRLAAAKAQESDDDAKGEGGEQ